MSISNYTELVDAVSRASFRSDLSSDIPNFIQLCEADMQIRLKLVDFEAESTLSATAGEATLPTNYKGMRAAYLGGDRPLPLEYVTPDKFRHFTLTSKLPKFYTIQGSTIKVDSTLDGSLYLEYKSKFTPLSGSNATNAIITSYPDAYMNGTMAQLYLFTRDDKNMAVRNAAYEQSIARIINDNNDRKYGSALQVRPS